MSWTARQSRRNRKHTQILFTTAVHSKRPAWHSCFTGGRRAGQQGEAGAAGGADCGAPGGGARAHAVSRGHGGQLQRESAKAKQGCWWWRVRLTAFGLGLACSLPCSQERLREAAEAELRAKQLEQEVQVGRNNRYLTELWLLAVGSAQCEVKWPEQEVRASWHPLHKNLTPVLLPGERGGLGLCNHARH